MFRQMTWREVVRDGHLLHGLLERPDDAEPVRWCIWGHVESAATIRLLLQTPVAVGGVRAVERVVKADNAPVIDSENRLYFYAHQKRVVVYTPQYGVLTQEECMSAL